MKRTVNSRRLLDGLRRVGLLPDPAGLGDAELLNRYLRERDEIAFEMLVRRHGPMVLGVCRRLLGNEADAEDAFQATFLVLVHKARSVVPRSLVGNWLHGVARHTALKAQAMNRKRRVKEKLAATCRPDQPAEDGLQTQAILDEEISRLPNKYRVPIVLCDLEGRALRETAAQLGWPVGTVAGRLARARKLLAKRLCRRGVTLSAGGSPAILGMSTASANVPTSLMLSTIQAATTTMAGTAATTGIISANVAALTQGVLKAMFLSKLKVTALLALLTTFGVLATLISFAAADPDPQTKQLPVPGVIRHQEPPQSATLAKQEVSDLVRPGDRLHIQVVDTIPGQPIKGIYQVESTGKVALGFSYGRLSVGNLTLEDAESALRQQLGKVLRSPQVMLTRYDPVAHGDASERELALERRVRLLEDEVRALKSQVQSLQGK